MTNDKLRLILTGLKEEAKESGDVLKFEVLQDVLEHGDNNLEGYIRDVLNHGCKSGCVSMLIHYEDTYKFYERNFEQIHEILDEIKDFTGEEFSNYTTPRYNTLAWLGYEETLRNIAHSDEINLDI